MSTSLRIDALYVIMDITSSHKRNTCYLFNIYNNILHTLSLTSPLDLCTIHVCAIF